MSFEPTSVLVVDDDPDTREVLHDIFGFLGCATAMAATGAEALARCAELRPDVIILDLGLPDLDGHEVARRLRTLPGVPPPRIIALTGWSQPTTIEASFAAGIDLHVVKPVELQTLRALLGDEPAVWTEGTGSWLQDDKRIMRPRETPAG